MGTWIKKIKKPSEYHFLIDDTSSFKFNIRVATASSEITASPKYYSFSDVLGRNGSTTTFMGTYENKQMTFECSFVDDRKSAPSFWYNQYRKIKNWIMSANDKNETHKLRVSDDNEWYMNIVKAEISECKRTAHEVGSFTITFTLEPFSWAIAGDKWKPIKECYFNPYYKCAPIYRIKNNNVNASDFSIKVNNKKAVTVINCQTDRYYYIDSDLQITYSKPFEQEGIYRAGRTGLEEYTQLESGRNDVEVTDGFEVLCKTRWRSL